MTRKRHLILLGCLLLGQLVLVSLQVRGGENQAASGGLIFQVFGPVAKIASGFVSGVADTWNNYVYLRGTREENDRLRDEVHTLRMEVDSLREVARQNERLRRLLALRTEKGWTETMTARVIALTREPTAGTIVLNRGGRHGLEKDMPVVTADGVVGRVVAVGPGTAKVQLLTDPSAGVAVVFERSRDHATGVAAGGNGTTLQVRYVSNLADVQTGDVARTSGLDGIYPAGLPVGRVQAVRNQADLMKEIQLVPSVPFGRLEEVLVLLSDEIRNAEETPEPEEATLAKR